MKKLAVFAGIVGLILSTTSPAATSYAYDELNRLTKVTYDDGRSISYVYDAAGNMSPWSGGSAHRRHTRWRLAK